MTTLKTTFKTAQDVEHFIQTVKTAARLLRTDDYLLDDDQLAQRETVLRELAEYSGDELMCKLFYPDVLNRVRGVF